MIVEHNKDSNRITNLFLLSNFVLWLSNFITKGIGILVIYIFIVSLIWFTNSIIHKSGIVKVGLEKNFNLIFLCLFSGISFLFYGNFQNDYIKPFFMFFILLISTISYQNGIKLKLNHINTKIFFFLTIILSAIIYLVPSLQTVDIYEQTRFNSFYKSPTVFAVYITAMYLIYFFYEKNIHLKFILYFVTFFFIVVSGTRINTLLFLFFFPVLFTKFISLKSKWTWVIALIVIPLFYPIFLYFQDSINVLLNRRGGGDDSVDDSTIFRLFMIWEQINIISKSSVVEHFFGHGSEACLDIFSEYNHAEAVYARTQDAKVIWTHFDFTRIYIDFGIFFLTSYFVYFLKTFTKSKLTSCMLLLYFISFYHNMYNDPLLLVFLVVAIFSE